jgi:hypothetical protein
MIRVEYSGILGRETQIASSSTPRNDGGGLKGYQVGFILLLEFLV